MLHRTLVLLAVVATARAAASDAEPTSSFDARRYGVFLHGGIGTPHGFGGVSLQAAPVEFLAFEVGAGWGFTGVQASGASVI